MKKRERLIRAHLKSMEEASHTRPEEYQPYRFVTKINYGFEGRKTIWAKEIENYYIKEHLIEIIKKLEERIKILEDKEDE